MTSIDPVYYDSSYYVAPDGKGADDVFAMLRKAIRATGKSALTRVVIAQRERTIAIRQTDDGLVAHTLNEQRDLNDAAPLFRGCPQPQGRPGDGQAGGPARRPAVRKLRPRRLPGLAIALGCDAAARAGLQRCHPPRRHDDHATCAMSWG